MLLTNKQAEYIQKATCRWNLKVGATGAGKSYIDSFYIIPQRILERKGKPGISVIMGVTRETIERNVLRPMREVYGNLVGAINNRNMAQILGEEVYCLGAEKANQLSKIQGATFKYLYGDEVARWNEEVFNFAKSRLRSPVSCFDGTLNPESPNHFLYKFIYQTDGLDIYCQHYTIDDNPNYPEREREELKKEYAGTVYYQRYILGEWTLAEGLIYPFYKDAIVKTEPREYTEYQISVDYGILNPFAMGLYGLCDGVWYKIKEYHHSGRDSKNQRTDSEYYNDLVKFAGDFKIKKVIVDPSAASFITLIRKSNKYYAVGADNTVLDGIRNTASAMKLGKVKINDCCVESIKEFQSYAWDSESMEDKPLKTDDHHCDELRYFVNTNKLATPGRRSLLD